LLLAKEKAEEKANTFNSLSDEAKQVINLVLNAPAEVLSVISSRKRHNITKKRIADMLQRQWKDRRSVNNVIREVEKYASLI
jgi:peroxiredoxin